MPRPGALSRALQKRCPLNPGSASLLRRDLAPCLGGCGLLRTLLPRCGTFAVDFSPVPAMCVTDENSWGPLSPSSHFTSLPPTAGGPEWPPSQDPEAWPSFVACSPSERSASEVSPALAVGCGCPAFHSCAIIFSFTNCFFLESLVHPFMHQPRMECVTLSLGLKTYTHILRTRDTGAAGKTVLWAERRLLMRVQMEQVRVLFSGPGLCRSASRAGFYRLALRW